MRHGAIFTLVFALAACSSPPVQHPPAETPRTAVEIAFAESGCIAQLHAYLIRLQVKRLEPFFSAALGGLVRCEATSGLAHLPTREINSWLAHASGNPSKVPIPPSPASLQSNPHGEDQRLTYQRICVAYLRRYLPASIARAGDDPDVAAAYIFNAAEQCDSDAGFATIPPSELAALIEAKHLL